MEISSILLLSLIALPILVWLGVRVAREYIAVKNHQRHLTDDRKSKEADFPD